MGGCASRLENCCVASSSSKKEEKKKNEKRKITSRRTIKGRAVSSLRKSERTDFCNDRNLVNQGSVDAVAFCDATSVLESELDDEYYSVHEEGFSVLGSETASPRGFNHHFSDDNAVRNEVAPVFVNEVSGVEDGYACGLLPNTCLPCLASTIPSGDKKKALLSPDTHVSKRKAALRLSFKFREGHATPTPIPTPTLVSPKPLLRRPIAGSLVPYCPIEKKMPNCWSPIEPSTLKVRGKNYFRDKKKDCAPNCAAFYPFGSDIFSSQRKVQHIARFVELPTITASEEVPSILILNVQIPLYPATIFQSENDGEGMNVVMYFKLSESYTKELPYQFQENITRLLNDEVERIKGFPLDTIAPFRERLKILGRLANVDDLQLSTTEKKLVNAYNEKPFLSRPQHEFYLGENYFEIDIDMHRFSYFSRKCFDAFQDRLKFCLLDLGLTIQGEKAEDLPEHILCCMRLNEIDFSKYHQLGC